MPRIAGPLRRLDVPAPELRISSLTSRRSLRRVPTRCLSLRRVASSTAVLLGRWLAVARRSASVLLRRRYAVLLLLRRSAVCRLLTVLLRRRSAVARVRRGIRGGTGGRTTVAHCTLRQWANHEEASSWDVLCAYVELTKGSRVEEQGEGTRETLPHTEFDSAVRTATQVRAPPLSPPATPQDGSLAKGPRSSGQPLARHLRRSTRHPPPRRRSPPARRRRRRSPPGRPSQRAR